MNVGGQYQQQQGSEPPCFREKEEQREATLIARRARDFVRGRAADISSKDESAMCGDGNS